MESPAKLRHMKQLALERIARYEREIGLIREEIEVYDNAIEQLQRLHGGEKRSNIGSNMQVQTEGKTRSVRISAGRATIASESRDAAVATDLTDGKIATICKVSRQAVQKWHAGLMAIPRRHAETLRDRKPKGIPIESWKRIGD